jgi:putative ABC transport system substrate-binding protein
MERRRVIGGAGGAIVVTLLAPRAWAAGRIYRIGLLEPIPASRNVANLDALRRGLRERGYVEGRNLIIEYRSSDGAAERFPALAAELAALKVDVILARGTPAARAAKETGGAIPVVMATMGDPRTMVASLAAPGGRVTGLVTFSTELTAKRIELLKEMVPGLARIALLHNMVNPAARAEWEAVQTAARATGLQARLLDVRDQAGLDGALSQPAGPPVEALVIGADGITQMHRQAILDFLARRRLPSACPDREFVEAGGLMAYSANYPDLYFRLANYVDKILKGTPPGDLPVEQPTTFRLVINLKTAAALGLVVPPSLLLRADEVIR